MITTMLVIALICSLALHVRQGQRARALRHNIRYLEKRLRVSTDALRRRDISPNVLHF